MPTYCQLCTHIRISYAYVCATYRYDVDGDEDVSIDMYTAAGMVKHAYIQQRRLKSCFSVSGRYTQLAAMSVAELVVELADVHPLVASTELQPETKRGMIAVVCVKVHALSSFGARDAMQLLQAATSFEGEYRELLQAAVEQRLQDATRVTKKEPVKQQLLTASVRYLTGDDWLLIDEPAQTAGIMISTIAKRYVQGGIRSLHEQTVKWAIMIVLHRIRAQQGQWPTYAMIHKWVIEFKRCVDERKRPCDLLFIERYPNDPSTLPELVFHAMYAGSDGPVSKELPGLDSLVDHVPLRSNSMLLQREKSHQDQRFGLPSNQWAMEAMWNLMKGKGKGLGSLQVQEPLPSLHIYDYPRSGTSQSLQDLVIADAPPSGQLMGETNMAACSSDVAVLQGSHAHSFSREVARSSPSPSPELSRQVARFSPSPSPDGVQRSPEPEPSAQFKPGPSRVAAVSPPVVEHAAMSEHVIAEDIEKVAYASLVKKARGMHRPAAAVKHEVKMEAGDGMGDDGGDDDDDSSDAGDVDIAAPPMKAMRAARAPLKRPASANFSSLHYKVIISKEELKKSSKKNVSSKHYIKARKFALDHGFGDSDAKEYARSIFRTAQEAWAAKTGH